MLKIAQVLFFSLALAKVVSWIIKAGASKIVSSLGGTNKKCISFLPLTVLWFSTNFEVVDSPRVPGPLASNFKPRFGGRTGQFDMMRSVSYFETFFVLKWPVLLH